ncbi:serine hydrolase domain-containing protein [Portibacter marinus]|uniref:serine hydrolase domain-containing protein n=1 Tax=Portibacter marinus TaxID=2898660 RepID=UPI001F25DEEB|nr:serine hydrolase domain-containing protein [Portibacter marinus]
MNFRRLLGTLILVLMVNVAFSQNEALLFTDQKVHANGIIEERLALLDQHIMNFIDDGHLPGGVFMISKNGEIVYSKSFGKRATNEAYAENDIFRLASMTKAITTVAILQLYENGRILLDDPLHYYFPEFKNAQIATSINNEDSTYTLKPSSKPITIRHLLTHTSGITYGVFKGGAIQAMYDEFGANGFGLSHDELSTTEMIQSLAKVPLIFEPGDRYSYGLNMEVLGGVIEKVTAMSLEAYVQKNILEPLEMYDTGYIIAEEKHERIVPVYTFDDQGQLILSEDESLNYPMAIGRNHFAGGGGMSGTAADYMKLTLALLNNGEWNGKRILSRKAIEVMTSDQMIMLNMEGKGFSKTPGITYGLGFQLKTEAGQAASMKSPGTFEWGGYFNTKFFIDPEEQLTFVGMTQVVPFPRGDFWEKAYSIVYSSLK